MSRARVLFLITLLATVACQDATAPTVGVSPLSPHAPSRLIASGDAGAALADLDAMDASSAALVDYWAVNFSDSIVCPPDVYCQGTPGACAGYQQQMMSELQAYHYWADRARDQDDPYYMLLYRGYARSHYNAAIGWSSKLVAGFCLRFA